jgi:hypothetical protein
MESRHDSWMIARPGVAIAAGTGKNGGGLGGPYAMRRLRSTQYWSSPGRVTVICTTTCYMSFVLSTFVSHRATPCRSPCCFRPPAASASLQSNGFLPRDLGWEIPRKDTAPDGYGYPASLSTICIRSLRRVRHGGWCDPFRRVRLSHRLVSRTRTRDTRRARKHAARA